MDQHRGYWREEVSSSTESGCVARRGSTSNTLVTGFIVAVFLVDYLISQG